MKRGILSAFVVIVFCCFGCKKEVKESPSGEYLPLTNGSHMEI